MAWSVVMATFQVTIDCTHPEVLTRFWALALRYVVEDPPGGFATWNTYWRSVGVPEDELDDGRDNADSLVDPAGTGPRIWFQKVPEGKVVKNRLHLDLKVGGGRGVPLATRIRRVTAEVDRLTAAGATTLRVLEYPDYHAVVMQDPRATSSA